MFRHRALTLGQLMVKVPNPNTVHIKRKTIEPASRLFSTTQVNNIPRSLLKLRHIQERFQCDDGRPVWLKNGFSDTLLYKTTLGLSLFGTLWSVVFIVTQALPPSWK